MLNEIMWDIFNETGSIYAYLYVKEYNQCSMEHNDYYNKNGGNNIYCHSENNIYCSSGTDRTSSAREGTISVGTD